MRKKTIFNKKSEKPVRFIPQLDVLGLEKVIAPVSYVPDGYLIEHSKTDQNILPSLLRRAVALTVDITLVMIIFILTGIAFHWIGDVSTWIRAAIFIFMWYLYDPLLTSCFMTLGQYIAGIRVRKYSDHNKRISFLMAALRFLVKSPLGWISFITIPFTDGRRAIHDLVSGSIVLKK